MTTATAEDFTSEIEAGAVVDAAVKAEPPWRLSGWAEVGEAQTWAHLALQGADGGPLLHVIANRFSDDAFARGIGFGWIGFAVDLAPRWSLVRGRTLSARCMKSGELVFEYDVPDDDLHNPVAPEVETSVAELILAERTIRPEFSFAQLDLYLDRFVSDEGAEEFVRRSYVYVLEREVDPDGLRAYLDDLRAGVPPRAVLQTIFDSPERREKPRGRLALPGEAAFPFYSG